MENLTLYIAIYGAVLATVVLAWDVLKYLRDRPHIEVKASFRILVGVQSEPKIGIDTINKGKRPVTIVAVGFTLDRPPNEPNIASLIDSGLPTELREGQSHTCFRSLDAVNFTEVLNAWARDAAGREYFSKKRPLLGK